MKKPNFNKFKKYFYIEIFMTIAIFLFTLNFMFFNFTKLNFAILIWLILFKEIIASLIKKTIKEEIKKDMALMLRDFIKKGGEK